MRRRLPAVVVGGVLLAALGATGMAVLATAAPATPVSAATTHWPRTAPTPEQVLYDQDALMRQALSRLRPQDPSKVDLYLIAFAGDGSENVFRNEADYAAKLFARRFGARGHVLVLENNPATLATRPLATWTNLETALAALHRLMDPKQDILMLYLTSHGSPDHTLIVDMPPLPLDMIGAHDLPGILHEERFRWKVVVVNACYAGGFIPPLAGPGTLVMTAARSDRSSFGCGSESRITYFGDALLRHALKHSDNLITAFGQARTLIGRWEHRDGLTPSDPQISIGRGIRAQLARWRHALRPAPAPTFRAASDKRQSPRGEDRKGSPSQ